MSEITSGEIERAAEAAARLTMAAAAIEWATHNLWAANDTVRETSAHQVETAGDDLWRLAEMLHGLAAAQINYVTDADEGATAGELAGHVYPWTKESDFTAVAVEAAVVGLAAWVEMRPDVYERQAATR